MPREHRDSRAKMDPFSEICQLAQESVSVAVHPTEDAFCVGSKVGDVDCFTWHNSPFADKFIWVKEGWNNGFDPEESAEDDIRAIAYSLDGAHIVCVNASGMVAILDSETGQDVDHTPSEANDAYHSVVWMDNNMFATGIVLSCCRMRLAPRVAKTNTIHSHTSVHPFLLQQ